MSLRSSKTSDTDKLNGVLGLETDSKSWAQPFLGRSRYQRLRWIVVLATAIVSIIPLAVLSFINFIQYERTIESETRNAVHRLLANNKQSLEFFLAEKRSALAYLVRANSFEALSDSQRLERIIRQMNDSASHRMFIDLGLIDSSGLQLSYSGPYDLVNQIYEDQEWFSRVLRQKVYVSNVFLGHRNAPHFAIATLHSGVSREYLLRATFDAEILSTQMHVAGLGLQDDLFLIDRGGVLQTGSRRYGDVMSKIPLEVPHDSPGIEVIYPQDENGRTVLLGYTRIADSPFTLMFLKPVRRVNSGSRTIFWLLAFFAFSSLLVLLVILWGSGLFVKYIREENMRRAAIMHNAEYGNKLASIGRLAAGVAHEINNPLTIINENTGLIKDIIRLKGQELPNQENILTIIDVVLKSVGRCKTITHRLLGFARHMDVAYESINILTLIREVYEFLRKESEYRGIAVSIECEGDVPDIVSDRGQLQQVFLNLFNNAVSAVKDGGRVDVKVSRRGEDHVSVSVEDNGVGISPENLKRIFEPFFTTKGGSGTGLGLSITYGIVKNLGGNIWVESELEKGTSFRVLIPLKKKE